MTLRPRRSLLASIGLQVVLVATPLLVVAAWALRDTGAAILIGWVAVALAVAAIAVVRFRRTVVVISRYGIVERGFFGALNTVAARDVAGVLRLKVYRGTSLETVDQLFVIDREGRCAFRMRGAFWDTPAMDVVARVLDVGETVRPEPVTMAELRATDSHLLYWFERGVRPTLEQLSGAA